MKDHKERIHEGKKYTCKLCKKKLSREDLLKMHILAVHEGHKDHKCKFGVYTNLRRHIREVHGGIKRVKNI